MGKVWVLDTDTKGTGAEMVPLEKVLRQPDPTPERRFIPPKPAPRPATAPEPKPPPRFRVVDVMTGEALAEDVSTREMVDVLERTRSVVDVTIDVWDPAGDCWRRLIQSERKRLWALRGRSAASA